MQSRTYRIISIVLLVLVLITVVAGFFYQHWFVRPYAGTKSVVIRLYPGQGLHALMQQLEKQALLPPESEVYFRLLMGSKKLKAGEYELKTGMTVLDLMKRIEHGKVKIRRFSIIPGWRAKQLFHRLEKNPAFEPESLTNKTVTEALGIKHSNPEGLFYPATYRYYWGTPAIGVLKKAYRKMKAVLTKEWKGRSPGLPFKDAYQALIAASLIEKETHVKEERPMIARVILNRLSKKMRLQIDPTVIYAIGDPSVRFVTLKMLKFDSPYNTYRHRGLPPTPICLPSRGSIHAALHPAQSDALFYVALGDGIHHRFSKTFDQHKDYASDYRRRIAAQRRNSLLGVPITLDHFERYWATHCREVHFWLPFFAGLGTLSDQGDWLLFPAGDDSKCHQSKHKRLHHEREKRPLHHYRGHRGSRQVHGHRSHSKSVDR